MAFEVVPHCLHVGLGHEQGRLGAGGLIYTAGVFVFISPKVKFRRAIWHGFVVTGAMTHWAAVLVG